jgi:hypothetical protein
MEWAFGTPYAVALALARSLFHAKPNLARFLYALAFLKKDFCTIRLNQGGGVVCFGCPVKGEKLKQKKLIVL